MPRYRLDDLGWYSFEKLVQSLLKADVGLVIESWGGRGDWGRDSYTSQELRFPDQRRAEQGPFIFQMKFVRTANAAGANWRAAILNAVRAEKRNIERRGQEPPRHYLLATNCPLDGSARNEIARILQEQLPATVVTSWNADDICDRLDEHPELRRSFPEIMSLRDLDELLRSAVSRNILNRSAAAIEEARSLIPVFVPTRAYYRACSVLERHRFVVLDGPPEMGKTAIARTIGTGHLMNGYQVVECRGPDDFFALRAPGEQQIFLADDAFGRTEYDPTLGRQWERDLPRVLTYLEPSHRLVLTSRKHILTRALRELDLTGKAEKFPEPGEVIVTADDLSDEEKTRMIYRHSRAASLSEGLAEIIRSNGVVVVRNQHFTPERIRRFVSERLPELASADLDEERLRAEVRESIQNPTGRMKRSFRALHPDHKRILVSLLEFGQRVEPSALASHLLRSQSLTPPRFEEMLGDLVGTFVRRNHLHGTTSIDWIHPSYRDLVIEELAFDQELREWFFLHMGSRGVKVALAHASDSPRLLVDDAGWTQLERRCQAIAASGSSESVEILEAVNDAAESAGSDVSEWIRGVLERLYGSTELRWAEDTDGLALDELSAMASVRKALAMSEPVGFLKATWESACDQLDHELNRGYWNDPEEMVTWARIGELVEELNPGFFDDPQLSRQRSMLADRALSIAEHETMIDEDEIEPDDGESARLERIAEGVRAITGDEGDSLAGRLSELAGAYTTESGDGEDYTSSSRPEGILTNDQIESILSDL